MIIQNILTLIKKKLIKFIQLNKLTKNGRSFLILQKRQNFAKFVHTLPETKVGQGMIIVKEQYG